MKKHIKILVLMIIVMSALTLSVKAADAIVTLMPSSKEVKKGDTFTVTINVACEDGINCLEGTISFDDKKIELQDTQIVDKNNWKDFSEDLDLSILCDTEDTIKSANIIKLVFKVKDETEVEEKLKITMSDIEVDTDTATDSIRTVNPQETEVTVVEEKTNGQGEGLQGKTLKEIRITTAPTKTEYTEGEDFNKTGMVVTAVYSDNSTKAVEGYTIKDGSKLKADTTKVTISYTENGQTKTTDQTIKVNKKAETQTKSEEKQDTNMANKEVPYAGTDTNVLIISGAILIVIAVISFIKYRSL